MPVMNGIELLEALKRNKKTKYIPVIAATASVMKDNIRMLLTFDFAAYVVKPIQTELLVNELIKYLPYTTNEPDEGDEQDTYEPLKLSQHQIKELSNDFNILRKNHAPLVEQQAISEVEDFANNCLLVSMKYNLKALKNYSEQLISAINSFDIEVMMKKINQFKRLISNIENEVNK